MNWGHDSFFGLVCRNNLVNFSAVMPRIQDKNLIFFKILMVITA